MNIKLLERGNILQLVLDNIPSYVFWKDRDGIYLGCNKKFAESAGLNSPHEIIGKSDYDLAWTKEDSDYYRKVDKIVMESGQAEINFEESQTINSETKWLRTSKIPLYDDENQIIGIMGAYEDITQRKMMELKLIEGNKNLRDLNSKLEIINTDLEQFTYATSHDMQEPLRTISSFVGLFDRKYKEILDENGKEYLERIKESAQRMSTITNQILSYSKIDSPKVLEEVDIELLLKETLKDLASLIQNTQAEVAINLPNQKVICQPERIKMVFHDLITNGIKFNQSEVPSIEIDFEDKQNEWHFTVSDNGIGINSDDEDYIFAPFKRLNNRRKFAGNGIGLSICRRTINMHGGRIWYVKKPNGTTFCFTISKTI